MFTIEEIQTCVRTPYAVLDGREVMPCTDDREIAAATSSLLEQGKECEVLAIERGIAFSHNILTPEFVESLGVGDEVMIRTPKGCEHWCQITGLTRGGRLKITRMGKPTYDWLHNVLAKRGA